MNVVILAAGYGTRMGELAQNLPKALLPIGGKSILEHLIEKLSTIDEIRKYYIVTNRKFISCFEKWQYDFRKRRDGHFSVELLNDGTTRNENRLGAVRDLQFVIDSAQLNADLIVTAGDNLFQFDLEESFAFYKMQKCDTIHIIPINGLNQLRRTGVVEIDQNNRVIGFEEKPEHPKSHYGCPPLYFFRPDTLQLIEQYLKEGQNPDAPGNFIAWLYKRKPVYAYLIKGNRFDVGDPETYSKAISLYS